ncbi:MAG: DoxX family protein [Bacteroidota bacterium]
MHTIKHIGKWLFILPFAAFGFLHFGPLEFSLPYIPSYLPLPAFWVYFTGVCLLAFTLSSAIKKLDGLAALLLGSMMLLFVLMVHIPKAMEGDFLQVIASFRDTAMAGAAFLYASTMASDLRYTGLSREEERTD